VAQDEQREGRDDCERQEVGERKERRKDWFSRVQVVNVAVVLSVVLDDDTVGLEDGYVDNHHYQPRRTHLRLLHNCNVLKGY